MTKTKVNLTAILNQLEADRARWGRAEDGDVTANATFIDGLYLALGAVLVAVKEDREEAAKTSEAKAQTISFPALVADYYSDNVTLAFTGADNLRITIPGSVTVFSVNEIDDLINALIAARAQMKKG